MKNAFMRNPVSPSAHLATRTVSLLACKTIKQVEQQRTSWTDKYKLFSGFMNETPTSIVGV